MRIEPNHISIPNRYGQLQLIMRQVSTNPHLFFLVDVPNLDNLIFATNCEFIVESCSTDGIAFLMHGHLEAGFLILINITSFTDYNVSDDSFYFTVVLLRLNNLLTIKVLDNVIASSIQYTSIIMKLHKFDSFVFFLFAIFSYLFGTDLL